MSDLINLNCFTTLYLFKSYTIKLNLTIMKTLKLLSVLFILANKLQAQNRALIFDGTNDYVECGSAFNANTIRGMECWVKFNTLTGTQEILSKSVIAQGIRVINSQ